MTIALDLAVSAGATVTTDTAVNYMDLCAFGAAVGFFTFHKDFNVLLIGFLICEVVSVWDIKLR